MSRLLYSELCLFFSLQKLRGEEIVLNKILFLYMYSYPDSPLGKSILLFTLFCSYYINDLAVRTVLVKWSTSDLLSCFLRGKDNNTK